MDERAVPKHTVRIVRPQTPMDVSLTLVPCQCLECGRWGKQVLDHPTCVCGNRSIARFALQLALEGMD